MYILGISAFYHDAAACLVFNGEIIAACQEERFTRKKNDPNFPINAITFCLNRSQILPSQIDYIIFYDKPFLKFNRLLETYIAFAPTGLHSFLTSMPIWLKDKLFQKKTIINELKNLWGELDDWEVKLLFSEHHLSHSASAFFPSPFDSAAVLTMDGVGEWATTSISVGAGNKLTILKEINFPHSLGLLYSAFTSYAGFKVNSGEYKVMGLAPYGNPRFTNIIKDNLIDIKDDGSFSLDMKYFNYCVGLTMTSDKFDKLFGGPPRKPEALLTQRVMDLAASLQAVTEEVVIKLARTIKKDTDEKNLCLAGGVALNCVANGKLLRENIFDNIWIQPASGDSGGAVGAALSAYYLMFKKPRKVEKNLDSMKGSLLGPEFTQDEIECALHNCGAVFTTYPFDIVIQKTAHAIADGKAVGWMSGRMEFGPRSLGCRSILADPRSPKMQKLLNLKVKYRESFRPFAPSILREDLSSWFELDSDSPYMLLVADVNKNIRIEINSSDKNLFGIDKLNIIRSSIPSVTHVDYSSRIQTVHEHLNPNFYKLIKYFKKLTGCPILINTSFNIRGEPIVCTPVDAYNCFMGTDLDILIVGNSFLDKNNQSQEFKIDYKDNYELD